MAASIESRVPFLDHELVEHVVGHARPLQAARLETKAVLREALRGARAARDPHAQEDGLPGAGRRAGCGGRSGRWSRSSSWARARSRAACSIPPPSRRLAEEHRTGRAEHGERLWLLVNLEIWHRVFLDGEDAASVMRAA